jgi:5-methylcytosine-specific restriction protein A
MRYSMAHMGGCTMPWAGMCVRQASLAQGRKQALCDGMGQAVVAMAKKILRPCVVAGCPRVATVGGRCAEHAHATRLPDDRASASQRGYGAEWRKVRDAFLKAHRWCMAEGCSEQATDVDHMIARAQGGTDEWCNLQALCHKHHSQKTARRDGGFRRGEGGVKS